MKKKERLNMFDKNCNQFTKLLAMVVFITNISQMPYLVESSFTRLISIPVWIIFGFICLYKGLVIFNLKVSFSLIISMMILVGILIFSLFTVGDYIAPDIVYCYYLSIFILLIGFWCSLEISSEGLKIIIVAYICSAVIVSLNVYLTYFAKSFDIMSSIYVYGSKNSVSQIIFTALVFSFLVYNPKERIMLIIKWMVVLFLGMMIILLKSRATLLGIAILFFITLLFGKSRKNIKISIMIIIIIFTALMFNDNLNNIVMNGILFAGRDASNLNSISSGRVEEWIIFPKLISGHELVGLGKYKMESFLLSVIVQYGFIFGMLFIIVSLYPVIWGMKNLSKENSINLSFIVIACSYWVNGIFEQLAPFGPGVKCYMLWLMFGILLGKNKNNSIR